jgi:hypothetical protein
MDPSPGDLVEIFADNTYGGIGMVIEVRNMYVLVKAADSRPLWYTRNEIAHLHATCVSGEWMTAP